MRNLIDAFLSLPIGGRAIIILGILLLIWSIFGRAILKIVSILPWFLKKLILIIYLFLEIPISALHSNLGNIFGEIDQEMTTYTEKFCNFMDKLFWKMRHPKTTYVDRAVMLYLVLIFYLVLPIVFNLTEKPFTFWQESYVQKEAAVIHWIDMKV